MLLARKVPGGLFEIENGPSQLKSGPESEREETRRDEADAQDSGEEGLDDRLDFRGGNVQGKR